MVIPQALALAIEKHAGGVSQKELCRNAQNVSLRYRDRIREGESLVSSPGEVLAYAAARMPATFSAVISALSYSLSCTEKIPLTLLDAGAGTGAATWAAATLINLSGITCFEKEKSMLELGQSLMSEAGGELTRAKWVRGDIKKDPLPSHADLVTASYMLNELPDAGCDAAVIKLWEAADMLLLIVEPGTPAGYSVIMKARSLLLGRGAHIIAPCPHESACKIPQSDPYGCHFSCRLPRSRLHREIKGGDAPFEDEKFIYLAASRTQGSPAPARVLRHPLTGKGCVTLELCTAGGLEKITLRKSDSRYKQAGKAKWGDPFTL